MDVENTQQPAAEAMRAAAPGGDSHPSITAHQKIDSLLAALTQYASTQPALVISLCYLLCSLLGLLFLATLFHKFGFNVLPYLELSDYLLAALNQPSILLRFAICMLAFVTIVKLDRMAYARYPRYAEVSERYYLPQYMSWLLLLTLAVPLSFLAFTATAEAHNKYKSIKSGHGAHYQLSLIYPVQDSSKTMKFEQAQLIARTVSYLFIWHEAQIKVVPNANIAALVPQQAGNATPSATPTAIPPKASATPTASPSGAEVPSAPEPAHKAPPRER